MATTPKTSPETIPEPSFTMLIISIAQAAYMAMGIGPAEQVGEKNLEMSVYNIQLLELLKAKTQGNLSEEESKLLDQVLFDARMRFVEIKKNEKK